MNGARRIVRVEGTAISLRGHDIDTDRIIPARFLKSVRFEGLEDHLFEDDRAQWPPDAPRPHPFSDHAYDGASVLVVNRNFGCGSSREHAPQALQRWGIRALVGESFSEIFFGNSVALGVPCVGVGPDDARWLQELAERRPDTRLLVDLDRELIEAEGRSCRAQLAGPTRDAFLSGAWDATGLLLDDFAQVESTARRLPYIIGF